MNKNSWLLGTLLVWFEGGEFITPLFLSILAIFRLWFLCKWVWEIHFASRAWSKQMHFEWATFHPIPRRWHFCMLPPWKWYMTWEYQHPLEILGCHACFWPYCLAVSHLQRLFEGVCGIAAGATSTLSSLPRLWMVCIVCITASLASKLND